MKQFKTILLFVSLTALLMPVLAWGEVQVDYLYNLSDFNGVIPYNSPRLHVDASHKEVYVMSGDSVKLFNTSGMEIFRFDYDPSVGGVYDVAVEEDGTLLLLVYKDGRYLVQRCNYRAEPQAVIELKKLPAEYADLKPGRLLCRDGKLYWVGFSSMKMVETGMDGSFVKGYDLAALAGLQEKERPDYGLGSFNFDPQGNFLFTLPVMGKAYRVTPDGTPTAFGKRGSGPGKFGIPEGIVADRDGNLFVTDKLRCMVLIFDKELKFVKEFGHRGFAPGNLIGPGNIASGADGTIYVSQLRNRGVSVYRITYN